MEQIKEYIEFQIQNLEKWDKNKTLSEFGKGKLDAFKDINEQLRLHVVGVTLPNKKEMMSRANKELIDWGYKEYETKKAFERGFKECFYWIKNKVLVNGN